MLEGVVVGAVDGFGKDDGSGLVVGGVGTGVTVGVGDGVGEGEGVGATGVSGSGASRTGK